MRLRQPTLEAGDDAPEIDGISFEGDTVVWTFPNADGCRCGQQALELNRLAREHETDVLGITSDDPEDLRDMAEKYELTHITLASDPDGDLADKFGVELNDDENHKRALFFVRDGQITDVSTGMPGALASPGLCPADDWNVSDTRLTSTQAGETQTTFSTLAQADEEKLFEVLEHPGVYVITGQRGSGKSSLAFRAADGLHDKRDIRPVTVGMPEAVRSEFPSHWVHVESIEDAPPKSVIVIDEAYAKFHARDAMSDENKSIGQAVNTSRHCDQTMLFVSQNAAHLDVGAASEADGLLMKEPGTFHMEFERSQFRDLSEEAKTSFDQLPENLDNREYVYVYTDNYQGMISNGEADWYNDDISKSYAATCDLSQPSDSTRDAYHPSD